MNDKAERWCILRTSSGNTLALTAALADAGFDVWTPIEIEHRRVGRKREQKENPVPMTPGFVFARDSRLHDLVTLSRSPSMTYQVWNADTRRMEKRGCPYFTVFRYQGQFPRVTDRALDPLRQAERRAAPRGKGGTFQPGQEVRCPDAGFDGLIGTVQRCKRRHALVLFAGFSIPVQIDETRLLPVKRAA